VLLLRRWIPVVIGLVGLIFAGVGVGILWTQTWDQATGTIVSCVTQIEGNGTARVTQQTCQVTWELDGVAHAGAVTLSRNQSMHPGNAVALRVKGDTAQEDSPAWVGYATGALGLVLIGGAVVLRLRSRSRARSADSASVPSAVSPG
jgi:hypothetical protein